MIYFDNAATTFPKPAEVIRSVSDCLKNYCGNPGRSAHKLSLAAAEAVYDARCEISSFFGSTKPENIIFTQNATHALNIAIFGIARPGDHILISNLEHNSVLRPVAELSRRGVVSYDIFDALGSDDITLSNIEKSIRKNTKIIITTHISNICPKKLPIEKISELCKNKGITHIVDISQSAGLYDIDMSDGYSVLCSPGHKGLYGPQGSGFCLFSDDFDLERLRPFSYGGNGVDSKKTSMGSSAPESFEAGTLAVPNIVGLSNGVKFVKNKSISKIRAHEAALSARIKEKLSERKNIKIYMPDVEDMSTLLFNATDLTGSELAGKLSKSGVCTRAGLHCSPLAHEALKTGGDAVRISFSAFNTFSECDEFIKILDMACFSFKER